MPINRGDTQGSRDLAALARALTCECGHSVRLHDTGWDAAGCMAEGCVCQGFSAQEEADAD